MYSANPTYRLLIALVLAVVLMALDQRTKWVEPLRYGVGYLTARCTTWPICRWIPPAGWGACPKPAPT